jgi:type IV secretory pathway VirJ component
MSNYNYTNNKFSGKDALANGDNDKVIRGSDFETEFSNIETAIATKADIASPSLTGTPEAPTASAGTNSTQIATTAFVQAQKASPAFTGTPTAPTASSGTDTTQVATTAFVQAALAAVYPVGSIYSNATNSTNPATLLGFGTWAVFGAGKVMVGIDSE